MYVNTLSWCYMTVLSKSHQGREHKIEGELSEVNTRIDEFKVVEGHVVGRLVYS
jgi:hypothetical protein